MAARVLEPTLLHPFFRGVRLTAADAAAGLQLSTAASWNQTVADWQFLLQSGRGWGYEAPSGALVASTLLVPYAPSLAWISMVLVSHAARHQGLATRLVQHALRIAEGQQWPVYLDATAEGEPVYATLGFRGLGAVTRWRTEAVQPAPPDHPRGPRGAMVPAEWAAWDTPYFGANREALLAFLRASAPELAVEVLATDGTRKGFVAGRRGRQGPQLGPLMADLPSTALALLRSALGQVVGPLLLDLVDGNPLLEAELRSRGLVPERRFVRMGHGPGEPAKIFSHCFLITGPEFG